MKQRIIGIIPVRMNSYRFPGKPLALIRGIPMLQHVYERAEEFTRFTELLVATCDTEIADLCNKQGFPVVMTNPDHPRAMDRCAEAARHLAQDDIVVVVQGDEPMLTPEMITAVVDPIEKFDRTCTLLALPIMDEELYRSPDTVKVVNDMEGRVLYTSRAPIPHFRDDLFIPGVAKRIGGIFGFRKRWLDKFASTLQTPLEILEECDSNRLVEEGVGQMLCMVPYQEYYSVDRPEDIGKVEAAWQDIKI